MNYKKLYRDFYKVNWDSKLFQIHHIDRDRENNDAKNLLLLPKKLHQEYHKCVSTIQPALFDDIYDIFDISIIDIMFPNTLSKLFLLKKDMMLFYKVRDDIRFLTTHVCPTEEICFQEYLNKYCPDLINTYKE